MVKQDKSSITMFIGAFVGLITFGIINSNYSIFGVIIGGAIGFFLGKKG